MREIRHQLSSDTAFSEHLYVQLGTAGHRKYHQVDKTDMLLTALFTAGYHTLVFDQPDCAFCLCCHQIRVYLRAGRKAPAENVARLEESEPSMEVQ